MGLWGRSSPGRDGLGAVRLPSPGCPPTVRGGKRCVLVACYGWTLNMKCLCFSRGSPLKRKRVGCGFVWGFFSFSCTVPLKKNLYHLRGLNPGAAAWLCVAAVVVKPNVKDQQRKAFV